MRILVIEDEKEIRLAIVRRLRAAGFAVDAAVDIADTSEALAVTDYDCVVLDRMLPSGDGLDLLAREREHGLRTPVLLLTARDTIEDRVAGFDRGGDDYLVKPFAMEELVARVRSLCRRRAQITPPIIRIADLEIDSARRQVRRAGVLLPLTAREFSVLEVLAQASGTAVSRSELIDRCWDEQSDPLSNVLDVHIASLRRKLGTPPLIHTVRGSGYLLEAAAP